MTRAFDLNMEEVLENWEPFHAIREIIANSLDEQLISDTAEIVIAASKDGSGWHIRDFGRGIEIEHFTQNEKETACPTSNATTEPVIRCPI